MHVERSVLSIQSIYVINFIQQISNIRRIRSELRRLRTENGIKHDLNACIVILLNALQSLYQMCEITSLSE